LFSRRKKSDFSTYKTAEKHPTNNFRHIFSLVFFLPHFYLFLFLHRSLVIKDIVCPSLAKEISLIFKENRTLKKLILRNNESTWTQQFGANLLVNQNRKLMVLDMSRNTCPLPSALMLSRAFSAWEHSLTVLNLSWMNLDSQSLCAILSAFEQNLGMSRTIQQLDISWNGFSASDKISASANSSPLNSDSHFIKLFEWIGSMGNSGSGLIRLNVSNFGTPPIGIGFGKIFDVASNLKVKKKRKKDFYFITKK
jgi:hypothetical protein